MNFRNVITSYAWWELIICSIVTLNHDIPVRVSHIAWLTNQLNTFQCILHMRMTCEAVHVWLQPCFAQSCFHFHWKHHFKGLICLVSKINSPNLHSCTTPETLQMITGDIHCSPVCVFLHTVVFHWYDNKVSSKANKQQNFLKKERIGTQKKHNKICVQHQRLLNRPTKTMELCLNQFKGE